MTRYLTFLLTVFVICSCQSDTKPQVVYTDESTEVPAKKELSRDTTMILAGELPIHFDSTDYLIFPVGSLAINSRATKRIYQDFSSPSGDLFSAGYMSGSSYSGNLENIVIQPIDSSNFRSITNQLIQIRSFSFYNSIYQSTGEQLLVMTITDRDTNNDGKLTKEDVESLYVANLGENSFQKLSADLQELLDWDYMPVNNRLYFRTLEDIDKNGEFNNSDKIHHFYVDLKQDYSKAVEFDPLSGL